LTVAFQYPSIYVLRKLTYLEVIFPLFPGTNIHMLVRVSCNSHFLRIVYVVI
jgi:hypothetical protein